MVPPCPRQPRGRSSCSGESCRGEALRRLLLNHIVGAENSVEAKHYDAFCSTILNHTVGAADDTRYALACRSIDQYRQTLHSRFAHLGDMLYCMGKYFLIDPETWRDYNEDPLGHAYSFMQFLLLGEMLRKDEPRNEGSRSHPLDIAEPRPAIDSVAQVRPHALQGRTRQNGSSTSSPGRSEAAGPRS